MTISDVCEICANILLLYKTVHNIHISENPPLRNNCTQSYLLGANAVQQP